MRMCDGILLVVDAVEGVMVSTEKAIRQAMQENLPICLLISKVHLALCLISQQLAGACHVATRASFGMPW